MSNGKSNRKKKRSAIAKNIKDNSLVNLSQNYNVTKRNRFQPLSDMDVDNPGVINRSPSDQKPKIPLIVITQKEFNIGLIKNLNLPDLTFKLISLGTRISFCEKASYEKCVTFLSENKIEFFTHRFKNNIFKAILSGLPQTDPNDIKTELSSKYNLDVTEVREIQTSYYNKNNRLYLICLNKNDITLGQLKEIKVINFTIVKWLRFSPKHKGPTQCRRCLLFGHGAENCHRNVICMLCASTQHSSDDCSFKKDPDSRTINFKCGNCQSRGLPGNHKANDQNCPCKAEYQNIRNHVRIKNSNRSNQPTRNQQRNQQSSNFHQNQSTHLNSNQLNANAPEFSLNDDQFPSLSRNRRPPFNPLGSNNSYSNVTKNQLLSPDEFFDIFNDALAKFYTCKTSTDQIALIASLLRRAIR